MTMASTHSPAPAAAEPTRRDFLYLATAAVGGVGAAATLWPLIDQMNPDAATEAAAGPVDIDLSQLQPGQQVVVLWSARPVFVVHRPQDALDALRTPAHLALLSDPNSTARQQPDYATNWHRSIKPEILVLVGVCTHLGCIPKFWPQPSPTEPAPNWPGGYFCPCHGSKYDLAGRVFLGVPAPYNLPGAALSFPRRQDLARRREPAGVEFRLRLGRAGVRPTRARPLRPLTDTDRVGMVSGVRRASASTGSRSWRRAERASESDASLGRSAARGGDRRHSRQGLFGGAGRRHLRRGGADQGRLLHHFASKEACAIAAAAQFAARADALFDAAPYGALPDPRAARARLHRFPQGHSAGRAAAVHLPARHDGAGGLRDPPRHPPGLRPLHQRARRPAGSATSPPPRRSTRPTANWRPESLALYTQAVLQGAFVLAKAKHGPEIAVECLDHLRRYVEMLLGAPAPGRCAEGSAAR